MPNVRGGNGTGFGGAASAGRNSASSSGAARSSDARNSPSSGRPGGVGNVGQTNSTPTYSNGAPIHTATGPVYGGIQTAAGPALQQQNQLRADTYNKAARAWNESANQRSFGNLVNNMSPMGLSMEPPDINRPSTFGGGDYHLGLNPAKMAGAVLGPYGSGLALGPLAGKAYTAMGGHNLVLGGPGDMGMRNWDSSVTSPQGAPGQPHPGQMANTGNGGNMGAFGQVAQAPGGAPFGPQPTPAMTTGGNPNPNNMGAFTPRLPNHTLPQGYNSAFPNSLSPEDMALLYGKALA